ncbi:VanZ family protein [Streptomyces sp. NPDC058200]|uniref:VanZ family protein n=1 Tax=Streptomyces sp. NPDC058200 TaxID=3346378 RepID=UPI0036EA5F0B
MLTAVFRGHESFVAIAAVLTLITGGIAYAAARSLAARPLAMALWAASTAATLSLTLWTTGGAGVPQCVINKDVFEPFRMVQGQLNAGMLVPFGLLGTLATRRRSLMASLSVLFPALIETTQGLAPFISRLCDTSDLIANTAGAACGVAIGVFVNRFVRAPNSSARHASRYPLIACGAFAVILAGSWLAWVEPVVMERTVSQTSANAAQEAAIKDALRDAFGGRYTADSVEFTPGEGDTGSIMAQFSAGAAELSWPDGEQLSVTLIPARVETGHTFPVPGVSGPVTSDKEAKGVAVAYARQFASWGLKGSKINVQRVDQQEDLGWLVSWRRWDGDVLLPMRLDVLVESGGRVSDVSSRRIDDPEPLSKVNISEQQAWKLFGQHFGSVADDAEHGEPVLLAARRDGAWRVHWLLTVKTNDAVLTGTVDATAGTFHNPQTQSLLLPEQK